MYLSKIKYIYCNA